MISELKNHNRLQAAILLGLSMLFSLGLIVCRVNYSQSVTYVFLVWNLFLAFIPLVISTFLLMNFRKIKPIILYGFLFLWLLFFPNAPYIATDLFHLKARQGVPLWYDLLLLFSFAWNGLIICFISLADIHRVLNKIFNTFLGWFFIICSIVLSGLGIYVGRYLRWNSWDFFTNPFALLFDLGQRFLYPLEHPRTWGFTLLFSTFLFISYLTIRALTKMESRNSRITH